MTESYNSDFGAPVGVYSAYLQVHQRGKERVTQVADTAIREMTAVIDELEGEIHALKAEGKHTEVAPLEKTLERATKDRSKAETQRDKMLARMDKQWRDLSRGSVDARGLKKFKAVLYGDYVEYQSALVRKIRRINLTAFRLFKTRDKETLPRLAHMSQQTNIRKIGKYLSHAEPRQFGKINRVISDKSNKSASRSVITPVSELQGQLVPFIDRTPMIPSSKRATEAEVVNFHVSEYTRGIKKLGTDMNRSAVLAVGRNKFSNYRETNRAKVRQLFQLELSQQLLRPERYDELEAVRSAIWQSSILGEYNELPVLDVPEVEIDHVTLSLLTLIGQERKMFQDEYEAMMTFDNQITYLPLEIDGQLVNVPARFHVHVLNTGVAEISTRRLDTDGFSIKGILGSIMRVVTQMGKAQEDLNHSAWKKMNKSFPAYEKRVHEKVARFDQLSREAEARGDTEASKRFHQASDRMCVDMHKARKLREQIEQAGGPANYDKVADNPYALGARVMVLSQLMGYSIHWHCKSGKDRTGMMDIEIKYLLESLDNEYISKVPKNMRVPPLELAKETLSQKKLRNRIALRGGNMEIAQVNTGEYGLKTTRRKENVARYGKSTAEILSGDSDRVSS